MILQQKKNETVLKINKNNKFCNERIFVAVKMIHQRFFLKLNINFTTTLCM